MSKTRSSGAETASRDLPLVVIVGLGPAGLELATTSARDVLEAAPLVVLRTARHPAAEELVASGAMSLDRHYEAEATFEETYHAIVESVVETALENGRVVYAVPGSPHVLESTVAALRRDSRVRTEVLAGLSFLDLAWDRLGIDPVESRVRLVDGECFATETAADPGPHLVAQVWSKSILSEIKLALDAEPDRPAVLLHHLGLDDELVIEVPWEDIDRTIEPDHLTALFVPELTEPPAVELARLIDVVRLLRSECPWDREQTHASLVRHLVEETYETIEAIDELDESSPESVAHFEEELGDVLCQVLFHATIAAEDGLFDLGDVARATHDKLVHRHPHVFAGRLGIDDASAVVTQWEQIKQIEKGRAHVMDGIPLALPALSTATKMERKAASSGLSWERTATTTEVIEARLSALLEGDASVLGELVFDLSRLGAHLGADPEEALRRAATRFRARFSRAEDLAREKGTTLARADDAERLLWWGKARGTEA